MVAPLLIMGAVAAGSALAQWYNSEQGRAASAAERAKVKEMLDNVNSPNFDPSKLTPEQYRITRKYVPQVANFVAEQMPELAKAASVGAVAGRDAQMNALNRLRTLSNTGTDEQSQLLQQEATNSVHVANRGRQGAIQEDFQRRGAGGGGMELLAQLSNAQAANDTHANMGRQNAMAAYQTKLQALRDSASLGGNIRQEDVQLEQQDNDVLNAFNQRTSANRNNYNQNVASTMNDADRFNVTNEQDIANRNTSGSNDTSRYNQGRDDRIKQATYDNAMSKVRAQAGVSDGARQDIRDNTRDNNAAIGGAGDAAQTGLAYYNSQPKTASNGAGNVTADTTTYDPLKRKYGKANV